MNKTTLIMVHEIKTTLRILTDDPAEPEILVRVKGRVRKAARRK